MRFVTMTQTFHQSLRETLGERLASFAPLKEILPIPVVLFPEEDFIKLEAGFRLVLSAQQKILRSLRKRHSQEEILKLFHVPPKAWRFIDWKKLDANTDAIGRVDIVPTTSGEYKFCELNIGPPVDGHQMHQYCEPVLREFGATASSLKGGRSTYDDLASLISKRCAADGCQRIVLLDLDSYQTETPLVYDEMRRHLESACRGYDVHLIKNSQYPEEWLTRSEGRKTLVFRLFLEKELVEDEWHLFDRIVSSGAVLLSMFEPYILHSKIWLALLCDPNYHKLLSAEEIAAIKTFIPESHRIDASNLDALLSDKDRLIFKLSNSGEGKDVLIGSEHSQAELRAVLESRLDEWIAQEFVYTLAPAFPQTHWTQSVQQNAVLGLYHIDGRYSGFLLRCNARSRVVNLASGGKAAWVLSVSDDEYNKLLKQVSDSACRKGER